MAVRFEDEAPNNDIKRLTTKSGHRSQLSDKAGVETIALSTPTSNRLVMTEKANETGRTAVVLHTDGDIILSASNGRIHLQSMLQSREVGTSGNVSKSTMEAPSTKTATGSTKWTQFAVQSHWRTTVLTLRRMRPHYRLQSTPRRHPLYLLEKQLPLPSSARTSQSLSAMPMLAAACALRFHLQTYPIRL